MTPPEVQRITGKDIPPGWSYSLSSWPQPAPMIVLAFISVLIARHLAAFQLGYIDMIWEPRSSVRVPSVS